MAVVLTFFCTIKEGCEAEYEDRMTELVRRMRSEEPGLLDVHFGRTQRAREYGICEVFQDMAARDYHRETPAERELAPAVMALMEPGSTKFVFEAL